jgi:hypothetical protein
VGKGALRAVPTFGQALSRLVGTLRFAHPTIFNYFASFFDRLVAAATARASSDTRLAVKTS